MNIDQHLDNIKNIGYTKIKNVFSNEDITNITNNLDNYTNYIENNISNNDITNHWYQNHRPDNGVLYDLYQRLPSVRSFCESKIILDIIDSYFKTPFYLYVNSYLYKPSSRENSVPWHQDFVLLPTESEKLICWISLDHSGSHNGGLVVVPNSHKFGFRNAHVIKGNTHHSSVQITEDEKKKSITVSTEPGDVLIFSNYLVHSSSQNSSNHPRRALRFAFKALDNNNNVPRGSLIMMSNNFKHFSSDAKINKKSFSNKLKKIIKRLIF